MKTAFIFSGQGAQYPGMFKDLYEKSREVQKVFEKADKQLGRKISALCFQGTMEQLSITENTQPCVLAADLASAEVLMEKGIHAQGVAGFSLGEYAAAVIAGVIRMEDSFPLVQARAEAMQEAVPAGTGTMSAVIGLSIDEVEDICKNVRDVCVVANYNAPSQVAISGTYEGVLEAAERVRCAGGKAIPLRVSGPFHCELMRPAVKGLKEKLDTINVMEPSIPMYFNFTGDVEKEPKELFLKQLYSPVQWIKTIENMYQDGFDVFIECGPGRTLSGLVKRILKGKEVTILHVEDSKTLEDTCRKLKEL